MMLGVSPRDSVFRLARLRLADGVPMAIERAAVPARFVGEPARVGDSLYAALDAEGWLPVRALQRLRAAVLGAADAALLDVAEGSAALDIHRIAYLADGRCVEFTRSFYRADTYDFVAELTLSPDARALHEAPSP
jgi:GntR family transcriptional regulator